MFGVIPKPLWARKHPTDDKNRCTWAMRCLLVDAGDRRVLIDTGIGDKQDERFMRHYEPTGSLEGALEEAGIAPSEITDVLLTHLHFDHGGGAVKREGERLVPRFPEATYWSHRDHWSWALNPTPRDRASFLEENFVPLEQAGRVRFLKAGEALIPGLRVMTAGGHTESMLVPLIDYRERTLVYMADLQPSLSHFPIPWTMAFDIRPLQTMRERAAFLEEAVEKDYVFFFEHDPEHECCTLERTEKGVGPGEIFRLKDW